VTEPGDGGSAAAQAAATRETAAPGPGTAAPKEEPLPTLQDEFAELTPDLRRSMFGKPAQMITGLLIGALMLVALLIGLTALAKDGAIPLVSPAPLVSPSAFVAGGWRA